VVAAELVGGLLEPLLRWLRDTGIERDQWHRRRRRPGWRWGATVGTCRLARCRV
jgi:hypothetical protein